jgi:hypothetical protein
MPAMTKSQSTWTAGFAILGALLLVYLNNKTPQDPPPPQALALDNQTAEPARELTASELVARRRQLAEQIDKSLIDQALESKTEARGTTLIIHFALAGRVAADRFGKALPFDEIRDAGFTKVVLTDDNDTSFSWKRGKQF